MPASDGRARATVLGEAEFSGVVAVTTWPVERARAAVPGATVRPPPGWTGDGHPVVVLFGVQASGVTHLAGLRLPLGRSYLELAVAVPGVCSGAGDAAATALVRMYADYFPAVWNGRMRYGFGKEIADIRRTDASFVVARAGSRPLCVAVHQPVGRWSTTVPPAALSNAACWLSGALVGWTPAGRVVRSASSWDVDGRAARPIRLSLRAFEPLLPGWGPGELMDGAIAAFEVERVGWSLGWPGASGGTVTPS